jgi:hypothetical protein
MADEKPRAPRARKPKAEEAVVPEKPATKKKSLITSRSRKRTVVAPQEADVATHAYLLWERGEPGNADELWLRAEQELAAA